MNKHILLSLLAAALLLTSCNSGDNTTPQAETPTPQEAAPPLAKVQEEQFDLRNDSTIFKFATIENFDKAERSIDIYWIGEKRDTTLRFYWKYAADGTQIGAEYFEPGDTEPNKDTVYTNEDGLRVEASFNAQNQISWKSTIYKDANGNEVLRSYENGKGEYRGFDSLYFDNKDRVVMGFYENARGKRYGIKTYEYLKSDQYGNWTERNMMVDDTLRQIHKRSLEYRQ
ncbi:MAG: hypothetical protein AAFV25_27565 [Bacteroidota bacterium]